MPQIQVLSPHVADLIAAGEVVERPASAVKELLENAVDAGAKSILCEIRVGGRESIRITDDGCGMSPEDAGICFLRHATSKLHDERGLEAIGTLGFRGEALAAISSVSRITMTTRRRESETGVSMEVIAGEIESMDELGCPEGTTIEVRNLFFNTPARQKFLGSDRAEGAACVHAALCCALAHPEVSFRCLRDGEEEFFSPGDGKLESAVYALLGRDTMAGFLPLETENNGIRVEGFISAPGACRGNRSAQYFFCNGRPIRSLALRSALEQAYKNEAMVGKFPGCVLCITLPNGLVDVNVHPTKAEVKFAQEKAVFDGVYYGSLAALRTDAPTVTPVERLFAAKAAEPMPKVAAKPSPIPTPAPAETPCTAPVEKTPVPPAHAPSPASAKPSAVLRDAMPYTVAPSRPVVHRPIFISAEDFDPMETLEPRRKSAEKAGCAPKAAEPVIPEPAASAEESSVLPTSTVSELPEQPVLDPAFQKVPFRLIGEALHMYILVEQGDTLLLVDKHAAHERILFDRMRLNDRALMSQELLVPETLRPDGEGAELIERNLPLLERLGFELEGFGGNAFAVRAVPADIDPSAAVPLLEELAEKLREGRTLSAADVWERLAETVACKAAIKAGWVTEEQELLSLCERVLSGEVQRCPHGRPVLTVFTRQELDRLFCRIV